MKAMVYRRYGPPDVLSLDDVEQPEVKEDGILVKVHAASINRSDWESLIGKPLYARMGGLRRPGTPILGSDIAGTVEAVGSDVTRFAPGDEVFGDILYVGAQGFAEYVAVPERAPLVAKPPGLSFEKAAALPQAGAIGLQALRKRRGLAPGQRVLINGAGGSAGCFTIQIAKSQGAEVTGVDSSEKFDFMRTLGCDHVIDYTATDYTTTGRYDLIIDLVASRSVFAVWRALRPAGHYYVVGGPVTRLIQAAVVGGLMSAFGNRHLGVLAVGPNRDDLAYLADMAETGELVVPIDRTYNLAQVPEALAYLGAGHSRGKLVITI